VPSIADNVAAAKISLQGVEQGKKCVEWDLTRIRSLMRSAYASLSRLLDSVDIASLDKSNVIEYLKSGRIDIPYASHKLCRNRVRCARDPSGSVQVVEPGNMAFDVEACEYASYMSGAFKSPRTALERAIRDLNFVRDKYDEPGKLAC
jgi:glutamate mutase epsilon subunit